MTVSRQLSKYIEDCRTFPADVSLGWRLGGIRGIWDVLAPRTIDRLAGTGHMVIFAQSLDTASVITTPEGVTIRPIEEADLPALSAVVMQRTLTRFRGLMAAGRHGLVAWRGPKAIGYGWVAERTGPDVTVCPLPLPPHAAYLWDLYVLPEERSNGIGSALATARMLKARELGFREGWRMISPSNAPSLRTLAKSGNGARIVGELRYVKLLSRVHSRFIPAPAAD
jgi:ribosomal protein S18 acetylase RimI-like enzyme